MSRHHWEIITPSTHRINVRHSISSIFVVCIYNLHFCHWDAAKSDIFAKKKRNVKKFQNQLLLHISEQNYLYQNLLRIWICVENFLNWPNFGFHSIIWESWNTYNRRTIVSQHWVESVEYSSNIIASKYDISASNNPKKIIKKRIWLILFNFCWR